MRFFSREERRSYRYLLAWLIIALFSGLLGALVVPGFSFLFQSLARFLQSLEGVPLWLIPLGGALLVGAIVYRLEPRAKGEGIPSYLHAMRKENGHLPFSETFYKFWAALITLGTFGNGGILGPIGRINAGLMSLASKMLPKERLLKQDYALFPICGLAAALGALVHSSIGAGIFAVEIIQKSNMSYRQLFPAILASSASVFFSQSFGLSPVLGFSTIPEAIDLRISGLVLLVALLAGLLGRGYIFLYSKISRLFSRDEHESAMKTTVNVAIGGLGSFLLVYYLHPQLIGTSSPLFNAVLTGNLESIYGNLPDFLPLVLVGFILIILKALANSLTVGSGLSAGFAGPAMLMGLLLGMGMAQLFWRTFFFPRVPGPPNSRFCRSSIEHYEYAHCRGGDGGGNLWPSLQPLCFPGGDHWLSGQPP
jgi:CIC family chloride channel protein